MRSNVCKIEKGTRDLGAILAESERVAQYNGLNHKEALELRLLCEEIDGMLPNVIDDFDGAFWIDFEDGVCKINIDIKIPKFNTEKKEELIGISRSKKNAAAVGIVGKIRDAIDNFFLDEAGMEALSLSAESFGPGTGYSEGVDYTFLWRLQEYRKSVTKASNPAEWDELEKAVIASVADDVTVGVKGSCAKIVILKKFN